MCVVITQWIRHAFSCRLCSRKRPMVLISGQYGQQSDMLDVSQLALGGACQGLPADNPHVREFWTSIWTNYW
eukprot:scaffold207583_cov24-Prasinocladus_malaysianus.AAC.1